MCTVVVLDLGSQGYALAVNRDELHSRGKALPPVVHKPGAGDAIPIGAPGQWLAPRDPDAQGTWVAANDVGLSVVLLNEFHGFSQLAELPIRSRGLIVQDLVQARDLGDLAGRALGMGEALRHTRPFELVAVLPGATGAQALGVHWDGVDLEVRPLALPVVRTSSVLEPDATRRAREAELPALQQALSQGEALHSAVLHWFARHEPGTAPRAVCMHRDIAETVSHTLIEVTPGQVRMRYHPDSPCRLAVASEVTVPRQPT